MRTTASQSRKTGTTRTNNNKQITMHNKYTNDDVDLDDCVAHMHLSLHALRICSTVVIVSHFTFHGSSSERIHSHPRSSTWRTLFDSFLSFYFYLFLLSVPVFLFHLELFFELHYTIVMANLRCSAAEESEDTLNSSFTSPTI